MRLNTYASAFVSNSFFLSIYIDVKSFSITEDLPQFKLFTNGATFEQSYSEHHGGVIWDQTECSIQTADSYFCQFWGHIRNPHFQHQQFKLRV